MTTAPRTVLALCLAAATVASGCGETNAAAEPPTMSAADRLQRTVRDRVESGRSTGIAAAVILPDGGTRIVTPGAGIDRETVFEIGSITKAVTGTLLADMVHRGEVALDDPVELHLPPEVDVPQRGGRAITLLDLATHTSGLPSLPDDLNPADPENPYVGYGPAKLYGWLGSHRLERPIGATYEYSNLGAGLLGLALANAAGTSYERLITERVLAPLGMRHTSSRLTPGPVHDERGDPVKAWDLSGAFAAAGALRSTLPDMLRFARAALQPPDSEVGRALAAAQVARRDAGPDLRVGLNWHVLRHGGRDIVWHNGGTGGSASIVGLDQTNRTAVVVLSNSSVSVDDVALHALDASIPLAPADRRKVAEVPDRVLERYTGVFRLARGVTMTITRAPGGLRAQLTDQMPVAIYARSQTEFFAKAVEASLTFKRDGAGLVLHQGDRDTPGRRVRR